MADHVHQLERAHAESAGLAHDGVDRGAVGRALVQQAQTFRIVGTRDAVDDETRRRLGMHRGLAPGGRGVEQDLTSSRSVARPETISTSAISGAGLKKCMPTRRSGACSPAAIEVTEIDGYWSPGCSRRRRWLRARGTGRA